MRNLFILAVLVVSMLWTSEASALCGRAPIRRALGAVAQWRADRPHRVAKMLKAVGKILPPMPVRGQ